MESLRMEEKTVGDYVAVQQIGSGSFSVVWRGVHKTTKEDVAIKEVPTEKLSGKLQESLESEISILRNSNHPNIVRLIDILKTPERIFLIMEFCAGGDLSSYIRKSGPMDELTAQHFMRQLGSGLQVLRANNLIHRDLKPQNLLLSERSPTACIKIADFGFARSLQPQGLAETLCGSPLYMAPEILQCQRYDAKADLWSVGAILFELVSGRPPYGGQNHVHLLQNIKRSEAVLPKEVADRLSGSCMSLIKALLKRNPVERLSFEEFFNHPFLGLTSLTGESSLFSLAPLSRGLAVSEKPSTAAAAGGPQAETPTAAPSERGSKKQPFEAEPFFAHVPTPGEAQAGARAHKDRPSGNLRTTAGGRPVVSGAGELGLLPTTDSGARPGQQLPVALEGTKGGAQDAGSGDLAVPSKVDQQNPSSSGSALDSFELLEREYVVVDPPSETASPQHIFHMSPSPSSSPGRGYKPSSGTIDPSSSPQYLFRASPSPTSSPGRAARPHIGYPSLSSSSGHSQDAASTSLPSSEEIVPAGTATVQQAVLGVRNMGLGAGLQPHHVSLPQHLRTAGAGLHAHEQQPPSYLHAQLHVHSATTLRSASVPVTSPLQNPAEHAIERFATGQPATGRPVTVQQATLGAEHHRPQRTTSGTASDAGMALLDAPAGYGQPTDQRPSARLARLSGGAKGVAELAAQKFRSALQHEALSLQLLCLCTWREALQVCHSWASSSTPEQDPLPRGSDLSSPGSRGDAPGCTQRCPEEDDAAAAAKWCDEVEEEYLQAVAAAEGIARGMRREDPNPVPDAAESVYQAALHLGRTGAVEELMGKTVAAESSYSRSLTLLHFLLWEVPKLPLSPPLELSQRDQQRLLKFCAGINARRLHCLQEMAPQEREKCGSII